MNSEPQESRILHTTSLSSTGHRQVVDLPDTILCFNLLTMDHRTLTTPQSRKMQKNQSFAVNECPANTKYQLPRSRPATGHRRFITPRPLTARIPHKPKTLRQHASRPLVIDHKHCRTPRMILTSGANSPRTNNISTVMNLRLGRYDSRPCVRTISCLMPGVSNCRNVVCSPG